MEVYFCNYLIMKQTMIPMKAWATVIQAIDPLDGEIKNFHGPMILCDTKQEAKEFCLENDLAYCRVIGQVFRDPEYPDITEIDVTNN